VSLRFRVELEPPTVPFPKSIERLIRLAEFAPPRSTLWAPEYVEESLLKKCCSDDCAATAASRLSCCSTNKTATRAKSRVFTSATKEDVGSAPEDVTDAAADGLDAGELTVVGVDVSTTKPPVALGISDTVLVAPSLFLRLGAAALAAPPNVTSAFSARQLRLAALKRARISFASSGTEKFPLAPSSSLGTELPKVAFVKPPSSVVVAQPVAPATLHVEPVNPLMQRQAQFPEFRKAEPPFWHDVAGSAAHFWRVVRDGAGELCFRMTKK
jgi:hypothetical protein